MSSMLRMIMMPMTITAIIAPEPGREKVWLQITAGNFCGFINTG